jgi:hypothetical protein
MHTPDRFDDADDVLSDSPRKAKSAFPLWLIVLLCALPIGAVVLIGGAVATFRMQSANVQRAETAATLTVSRPATNRLFTRDEFRGFIGATPDDVMASVGPPEFRTEQGNRTTWHFKNKSRDPATGKIDPVAKVVFEGGVVIEVSF